MTGKRSMDIMNMNNDYGAPKNNGSWQSETSTRANIVIVMLYVIGCCSRIHVVLTD